MLSLLLTAALALQTPVEDGAILDCVEIKKDKARLQCYDETLRRDELLAAAEREAAALAAQAQAAETLASEQARIEALEAELAAAQARAEAAERRAVAADVRADEVIRGFQNFSAKVLETHFSPLGTLTVKLDNGQTWQQLDSDDQDIDERRSGDIQNVAVRQAMFGSRRMRIEPLGKTIRVKRVDED